MPKFNLDDIRFSESKAMYNRAQELFDHNRVTKFESTLHGYRAIVSGTHDYNVSLSPKALDRADCSCYMGQNDMMCKHVLALALMALSQEGEVKADNILRILTIPEAKSQIAEAMKKISSYSGPSKTWFTYQRQLSVGAGIIAATVEQLPPTQESAILVWNTILRLSKKLATGGVDDSDGAIGNGCCLDLIEVLLDWSNASDDLYRCIEKFTKDETGFDFEKELRAGLLK